MSKNEKIAVFIAVSLALVFFIYFGTFSNSSIFSLDSAGDNNSEVSESDNVQDNSHGLSPDNVQIDDLVAGSGDSAIAGSIVTVHYVGTLEDGTQFDSSIERGQPIQFLLGQGDVIEGWDIGLLGMREGGIRRLVIPPNLGYGPIQAGPIPPNSTLIFEVELVDVSN